MKFTRKNQSDTQITLTIELDAADLAGLKPHVVAKAAKNIKVPGFRPGKVPPSVAEKHLDQNALNLELAEDAINHVTNDILADEKIQPLDRPKVDITAYVPGQELKYTAEIEILPAIKLGEYKNLDAKKEAVKVSAKEITEVIDRMRQGFAEKNDVERAAKLTDEVWVDFEGKDKDGKVVAGASGKDYPLTLGSSTFIPGFEEGLVGKKAGEVFDLPLTFPKDYHHKPLAGADVTFTITVKKVKEVALPEVNDEFAAKCGPFTSVEDLKADVTRELTTQKEREAVEKLKDNLVEQLVKGSDIPTPEILVTDQLASLERDFTQNLIYRGITLDQYLEEQNLTKDKWRETELRDKAVRRVEVGLALAELSKVEEVQVSTAELNERLAETLQQYGNDPKIRQQLDTPESRRDLANRVMTEKTVDRLVELNTKSKG